VLVSARARLSLRRGVAGWDHDPWSIAEFAAGEFRRQPNDDRDPGDHRLGPRMSVVIERNSMIEAMRQLARPNAAIATIARVTEGIIQTA
jgi:hypothetical protein